MDSHDIKHRLNIEFFDPELKNEMECTIDIKARRVWDIDINYVYSLFKTDSQEDHSAKLSSILSKSMDKKFENNKEKIQEYVIGLFNAKSEKDKAKNEELILSTLKPDDHKIFEEIEIEKYDFEKIKIKIKVEV